MRAELITSIKEYLTFRFSTKVRGIFGIGSLFVDDDPHVSDADVVVILTDTSECSPKEYTTALFDDWRTTIGDKEITVTFLYGTLDDYLDKTRFNKVSFADWSWAVRSLKHASTIIGGEDIRPMLPDPEFDYRSIFLRSAYHLNHASNRYSDEIALTKAIFKFGFFLVAVYYPEKNVFDRTGILRELKLAVQEGNIRQPVIDWYETAIRVRNGESFRPSNSEARMHFAKIYLEETLRATDYTYDLLRGLLSKGFGNGRGFTSLISLLDYIEEERKKKEERS